MPSVVSNGKPKKITVVLKKRIEATSVIADDKRNILLSFIDKVTSSKGSEILELASANFSFEELYSAVADACFQKLGHEMYRLIWDGCTEHARRQVRALAEAPTDGRLYVAFAKDTWEDYCVQVGLLRAVFSYLERHLPAQMGDGTAPVPLADLGTRVFGDELCASQVALGRSVSSLIMLLQAERNGESIDRNALSTVVRMLLSVDGHARPGGLYSSHAEPAIVKATDLYYEAEGAQEMEKKQAPEYLSHANSRINQEQSRCAAYLTPSTWRSLKPVLQKRLIAQHAPLLLERGFPPLIAAGRADDLALMYNLFSSVGRTDELRKAFGDYCKATSGEVVGTADDEERDKQLVQSLLDFKDAQDELIAGPFHGNEAFAAALKGALEIAANRRDNKPAELTAKYLDARMKAGGRATGGDAAMDVVLDKVLSLFRLLHGKDVFEAFYKKDLAKRLLLGRSSSMDTEKSMVARLKTECGAAFTSKLEGMFKDAELSAELMTQYDSTIAALPADARHVETFVHVLTSSYWPSYTAEKVRIPVPVAQALTSFEKFYMAKYNTNRRLAWVHSLGHCVVRATFPSGKHELDVSMFQAMVLLLFNGMETSCSFTRIKEDTGIPDEELRRTLQSLFGQRVLRKDPKGKEVGDADVFSFNTGFTHQMFRIKINQIQMKETKQEADATTERVMQDRQYQLDAAIVRIMKSRKSLGHQALLGEVFAQLRFPAKAIDVKKRIESLIERDYLERDGGGTEAATTYNYLA